MDPIDLRTVGGRLRAARKRKGLTQVQLAQVSGVGQSAISELESNKTPEPTATTLAALCQALDITMEYAIAGSGSERAAIESEALALLRRASPIQLSSAIGALRGMLDQNNATPADAQQTAKGRLRDIMSNARRGEPLQVRQIATKNAARRSGSPTPPTKKKGTKP